MNERSAEDRKSVVKQIHDKLNISNAMIERNRFSLLNIE